MCINAMPWSSDLRVRAPRPGIMSFHLECSPTSSPDLPFALVSLQPKSSPDLGSLPTGSVKSWGSACSTASHSPTLSRSSSISQLEEALTADLLVSCGAGANQVVHTPTNATASKASSMARDQLLTPMRVVDTNAAAAAPGCPTPRCCQAAAPTKWPACTQLEGSSSPSCLLLSSSCLWSANNVLDVGEMLSCSTMSSTSLQSAQDMLLPASPTGTRYPSVQHGSKAQEAPAALLAMHMRQLTLEPALTPELLVGYPSNRVEAAPGRAAALVAPVTLPSAETPAEQLAAGPAVSGQLSTMNWPDPARTLNRSPAGKDATFQAAPIMLQPIPFRGVAWCCTIPQATTAAASPQVKPDEATQWDRPPRDTAISLASLQDKHALLSAAAQHDAYARQLSADLSRMATDQQAICCQGPSLLRGLSGVR